jgi:hypothetical protein
VSSLLDRIGAFFVAPPPADAGAHPEHEASRTAPLGLASSAAGRLTVHGFVPPNADAPPAPERSPGASPDAAIDRPEAREPAASTGAATAEPGRRERDADPGAGPALREAAFSVVLGGAAAVPVAAACAGELRAQAREAAATLCLWRGGTAPSGATIPAVRRVAARLVAHGLPATACGRLAWLSLDDDAEVAAAEVRRARTLTGLPLVLAVAGPRPAAFEPLVAAADHALAVLPPEAEDALRAVALSTLPAGGSRVVAPLPQGPLRWAAMAGLARMRSLRAAVPR